MFTGIIAATTKMHVSKQSPQGLVLTFATPDGWDDLQVGESIATNGVCLTITAIREHEYDCEVIPETLKRTSFGTSLPTKVNLERALSASGRLDGHFVQGHVDDIGTASDINQDDGEHRLTITINDPYRKLIVYKGSITIDGVSLTIAAVENSSFSVALIPHTLEHTTLGQLAKGDTVNLEFDIIGKYVLNSVQPILTSHASA